MKIVLLLSIMALLMNTPAFAATAIRLSCSLRKNVVISRFGYQLSTMKWGNQFQIASGEKHARNKQNTPYNVTHFRNGDSFVAFPTKHLFYLFYNNNEMPDRCYEENTFSYAATNLPRVKDSVVANNNPS